jgi:hypothetical protein
MIVYHAKNNTSNHNGLLWRSSEVGCTFNIQICKIYNPICYLKSGFNQPVQSLPVIISTGQGNGIHMRMNRVY